MATTTEEVNKPSSLPDYSEMILAAIEASNSKEGSNKTEISNYISSTYGDLPENHSTLLSTHLNKLKESGKLDFVKNNYMKPNPEATPKRGRGRPPKPKPDTPTDVAAAVLTTPRPRGRPPKAKDPLAVTAPVMKKTTPSSGKPRGRPPKAAVEDKEEKEEEEESSPPASAAASVPAPAVAASSPAGTPRGRGRPPKAKAQVAAVGV